MCKMCHKYGKRLILTPINAYEQQAWDRFHRFLGPKLGLKAFRFWHQCFVKE